VPQNEMTEDQSSGCPRCLLRRRLAAWKPPCHVWHQFTGRQLGGTWPSAYKKCSSHSKPTDTVCTCQQVTNKRLLSACVAGAQGLRSSSGLTKACFSTLNSEAGTVGVIKTVLPIRQYSIVSTPMSRRPPSLFRNAATVHARMRLASSVRPLRKFQRTCLKPCCALSPAVVTLEPLAGSRPVASYVLKGRSCISSRFSRLPVSLSLTSRKRRLHRLTGHNAHRIFPTLHLRNTSARGKRTGAFVMHKKHHTARCSETARIQPLISSAICFASSRIGRRGISSSGWPY